MMIRVPVFDVDPGKLIVRISESSSSFVLKGEYCRMACRLDFWSSLTQSKGEVKDGKQEKGKHDLCKMAKKYPSQ